MRTSIHGKGKGQGLPGGCISYLAKNGNQSILGGVPPLVAITWPALLRGSAGRNGGR